MGVFLALIVCLTIYKNCYFKGHLRLFKINNILPHESNFKTEKNKFELSLKTTSLSSINKPVASHFGWISNTSMPSKKNFSANIEIKNIELSQCQGNKTPILNRAGLGLFLKKSLAKTPENIFAFIGFGKAENVDGMAKDQLYQMSVVLKCQRECLVLNEYTRTNSEKSEIVHMQFEKASQSNSNFEIYYDDKNNTIEFKKDFQKWSTVILPKWNDKNSFDFRRPKIDIGNFIAPCEAGETEMLSQVVFSNLVGFE